MTFQRMFTGLLAASLASLCRAQDPPPSAAVAEDTSETPVLPSIGEKLGPLALRPGLLETAVDADTGTLWMRVPPTGDDGVVGAFLYVESLARGLGSNPIGLDRGQLGTDRLVTLRVVGGRLLVEAVNLDFRAIDAGEDERAAVDQSFARSILWAGTIAARDDDGAVLVDLTSFVVRDAHDVAGRLANEGDYALDADRSVLEPDACLAFPDNLEMEASLTFAAKKAGRQVAGVSPDGRSVTLVQHHALIRLPDAGYTPRRFDPRVACFTTTFHNYAAPLDEPLEVRWINRHRLEKVDPSAPRSRVKEPIVYYVDRGAPDPVRTALIEGAKWWNDAFEAAGFIDAFDVRVMPEDAHPLDVRYNVIQWVHRSTRGWSYGGSVTDPRTGEIIKGHVSLGSLRVRQDRLLFEGLAGTAVTGTGRADDPIQLALARIRQLSAHEVGHTLGFAHNFAASTYDDRASVMDYPAPLVRADRNGRLDFSKAYAVGIGSWDEVTVDYAYRQARPGENETRMLDRIAARSVERDMIYLSDADARAVGSADPRASLWDNGANAVDGLGDALAVRSAALASFGRGNLADGQPLWRLREVFAPVYLHHRYQLDAAVKVIGGRSYGYTVNDGQATTAAVATIPAHEQRRALAALCACMTPAFLDIPDAILDVLPPVDAGGDATREMFTGGTAPLFDPVAAAVAAARPLIDGMLHPTRCNRLVEQHRRDADQVGISEVLDAVVETAFAPTADRRHEPIRAALAHDVVVALIRLANEDEASATVRSATEARLRMSLRNLEGRAQADDDDARHLASMIQRYLARPVGLPFDPPRARPLPPGSPIGTRTGCGAETPAAR
ncbi:MAG: zinc-dependent metalloprotease [Planctomycetota bacterium]